MTKLMSEIVDVLEKETPPLNLRQKFILFMLPDKKLSTELKLEKHKELKNLEDEFKQTDLRSFHRDMYRSLKQILKALKRLHKLDLCPNNEDKQQKLNTLKSYLRLDHFNYSSDTVYNIRRIIKELSCLCPAQYETASKICEIIDIKKSLKDDTSIQITTEFQVEEYYKIRQTERTKQDMLATISNELLTFEYALTATMNDEIIFSLAYVDNDALCRYAPTLSAIIRRRTSLYKNMWSALPVSLRPNIKDFNSIQFGEFRPDDRDFLYHKLRSVINTFNTYFHPELGHEPKLTVFANPEKLELHLKRIMSISKETNLLDIRNLNCTNLEFIMSKFDLTLDDIANVLGVTKQAVSQQNKLGPLKAPSARLWDLARIFNASIDFWQEKTTIPFYGKIFAKIDDPLATNDNDKDLPYVEMRVQLVATAEKLLSYFDLQLKENNYLNQALYKQEKNIAILKIIGHLKRKIRDSQYPVDNLNLIAQLVEKL